jgi:two-component system cell cycle response regulator
VPARILLIEDNPTNLELMVYLLSAYGYEPTTAMDGLAGIEAAQWEHPDLIVCDVQLPKADGFEVVRQLKAQPDFQKIPLIAVTALAMLGDRARLLIAGFDGYIDKPIHPEIFVQQVEAFLPGELRSGERRPGEWTEAPVEPRLEAPSKGTVLVVDDAEANRDLSRSLLEPYGYRVVAVSSLAKAAEELGRVRPDLILTDVHLGDGNSIDFIRILRADAEFRSVPVVVQSASAEELDSQEIHALGGIKLLRRPLEAAQLLFEIEAALLPERTGAVGGRTST